MTLEMVRVFLMAGVQIMGGMVFFAVALIGVGFAITVVAEMIACKGGEE